MNKLFDVLEICLKDLERGVDLDSVLARYPEFENELRPLLKASINAKARGTSMQGPSSEALRRGRAKFLQQASEMREQKSAPIKRMIPVFQRLAISFSLSAAFLASGTGLVSASSTALPGENLYPVKRSWEDVRLFFTFNSDRKELLASEFESERLDEVSELLTEGRDETIQFAGIFMQVNGVPYVSGVTVIIPVNLQAPPDGTAVIVTGRTNAQGFVEIESIDLLPEGAVVPLGNPVEVDDESGSNFGPGSNTEGGSDSNSGSNMQSFETNGTVQSISNNILIMNGQSYLLHGAKIDGVLKSGASVEIKGYYAADGSFIVTEIKVKDSSSGSGSSGNSGSDSSSTDSNDSSGSDDGGSSGGGDGSGGGGDD